MLAQAHRSRHVRQEQFQHPLAIDEGHAAKIEGVEIEQVERVVDQAPRWLLRLELLSSAWKSERPSGVCTITSPSMTTACSLRGICEPRLLIDVVELGDLDRV